MLSTDLQALLWGNRTEPLYVAQPRKPRPLPIPKSEALNALASGHCRFFGPVPRIFAGNDKQACARSFDALWCDIDRPGIDRDDVLADAERRLAAHGLLFSAAVWSGSQGIHGYIKLTRDVPIGRTEDYNKVLRDLLSADSCWDRTRFLRHPGTVNEKSGQTVEIMSFNATLAEPEVFERLAPPIPIVQRPSRPGRARTAPEDEEWLAAAEELGGWQERPDDDLDLSCLTVQHWHYFDALPRKGYRRHGVSRSEIEAEVVYRLVGKGVGASDAQVKEFADTNFARHREEMSKRGDYYIDRTIQTARRKLYHQGWITSPLGGYPRKRDAKYRHLNADHLLELLQLVEGQTVRQFVERVQATGRSRSTAYRLKDALIEHAFVVMREDRLWRVDNPNLP